MLIGLLEYISNNVVGRINVDAIKSALTEVERTRLLYRLMAVKTVSTSTSILSSRNQTDVIIGTVLLHLFAAVLLARHDRQIAFGRRKTAHIPNSNGNLSPPSMTSTPTGSSPTLPSPPSAQHISSHPVPPIPQIKAIYITAPNPFPALDAFVLSSAELYGLDLYRFGGGMKAALGEYLGCEAGKGVKGMLMGTRKGDPNGGKVHHHKDC